MWIAEAGEELVHCQQILTHTIVSSIHISSGQLSFWLSPALSHSGINSTNIKTFLQDSNPRKHKWAEEMERNKKTKNVSGLTAPEKVLQKVSQHSVSATACPSRVRVIPSLKFPQQIQKINACSRVVPRSHPTCIRRLQRALHLAGWGLLGLGGEIPLYGWRWMTAIWALVPCCEGWQGCCLSCSGQFLQWYHYPSAIWQA